MRNNKQKRKQINNQNVSLLAFNHYQLIARSKTTRYHQHYHYNRNKMSTQALVSIKLMGRVI